MCVKVWKRIAEHEAKRYRDYLAFQRGVEDAGGVVPERYRHCRRWTLAVEYVLEYLHRVDMEKERFMRLYCEIDGQRCRSDQKGMLALSFIFHVSPSTLYDWRKEIRTLLVIAAAQTGAMRPYAAEFLPKP